MGMEQRLPNTNSALGLSKKRFTNKGEPCIGTGNYKILSSSSNLKDSGEALASVPRDYRGLSRPKGSGYSIGAFEEGEAITFSGVSLNGVKTS